MTYEILEGYKMGTTKMMIVSFNFFHEVATLM